LNNTPLTHNTGFLAKAVGWRTGKIMVGNLENVGPGSSMGERFGRANLGSIGRTIIEYIRVRPARLRHALLPTSPATPQIQWH
ncbi:hypothetical protein FS842_004125, partial [Serendipita sp. 407]